MTYTEITEELEEFNNIEIHDLDEVEIEDTKSRLVELGNIADKINENDEGDGEFSDIMEEVEALIHMINEELSEREEEEDYDF